MLYLNRLTGRIGETFKSFGTSSVPDVVSFTAVWPFCCCRCAFFVLCNANIREVRFRADSAACLTSVLGNMMTITLIFAAACGLLVMFPERKCAVETKVYFFNWVF